MEQELSTNPSGLYEERPCYNTVVTYMCIELAYDYTLLY